MKTDDTRDNEAVTLITKLEAIGEGIKYNLGSPIINELLLHPGLHSRLNHKSQFVF
jgi:hypothetical protein